MALAVTHATQPSFHPAPNNAAPVLHFSSHLRFGHFPNPCDAPSRPKSSLLARSSRLLRRNEDKLFRALGEVGARQREHRNVRSLAQKSEASSSYDRKKEGNLGFDKPKFSYIFCDMDGTLLNSKSLISPTTAKALREATSRGMKIVVATGKARSSAIDIFEMVGLAGKDGIVSEFSPGIFLQGLLVYGREGQIIFRSKLDPDFCREACLYSLESKAPLVAFSEGRCFTLFDDPLADYLHTDYREPKAEIVPSVEDLVATIDIQKMIFLDNPERLASTVKPYWSEAAKDRATVIQTVPELFEIIPFGISKGNGVKMLLDHLGVAAEEIMAIGDGENDIGMLELAALGVALNNGSDKLKAVADVICPSNDEDGVADAIYRYAF